MENNLENSFGRITVLPEDEEVAKQQIAEDLSLYGSRPDPLDAVEVNEHTQLSNLPSKRSAAEFDAPVDRPVKVRRKKESKEFGFETVTAMDWNSGATPLDAWLNQSAVPSIVPLPQTQRNTSGSSSDDLAVKELEDLKFFRTIHIEGVEEPKSIGTPGNYAMDLTILEPRTQIYLRNILDRYPLLPSYLALRLAKANCARANRLDLKRHNRGDQITSKPLQSSGHNRPQPSKRWSSIDDVAQSPKPLGYSQDGTSPDLPHPRTNKQRPYSCATCPRSFARLPNLKRHEQSHIGERSFSCGQCTQCFSRRVHLLRHQRVVHMTGHMTGPPLSREFRHQVTLNAPTAMIRQADEIPLTYLKKGSPYAVTIHDSRKGPQSTGLSRYRTVFRISFEDEQQRQNPSACWQYWKESRGVPESILRGGKLEAIEYVGPNSGRYTKEPHIKLETAYLDKFSVTWSPAPDSMTASCSILLRFNFLCTDFSQSKGVEGVPVRLYAETETSFSDTSNPLLGPTAEICFCRIKLFKGLGADVKLLIDERRIDRTVHKLEQQIALIENGNKDSGSVNKGVDQLPGKVSKCGRALWVSSQGSNGRSAAESDLHTKLAEMRYMLSSSHCISVFHAEGGEQDDLDDFSELDPEASTFRQQPSSRTTCMICSKSDHQLEDCPFRKREFSNSRASAGFWTIGGSRSRASSVQSQSSKRNSSLHGSGRLDLEDQDLSFPDNRSRRSSASFSESSAAFPPPPVYIERERLPSTDGGKEIMDEAPKPLRFFCDICEQEIEVLRRRDWQ